ncbi:nucleoside triphosphatase YtkD [Neobacillus novalis]|uniref:Nucleoside triphosphatase YtkD n=1 Tax=Neobacillus novalis TaxID=220687 RepID=A0AA95MK81_9BACI|nr:nucleoside triphosphatase YtkD [Neobacillus novalis]WHY85085.1 nucleoside triphosphatase YtkD [Neobacillus novalis]
MIRFLDDNGNKVELSFSQGAFEEEAKHVLVICQFGEGWLLTNHKQRGLEFPGGKREPGETLEEAARREAYEETGAILADLNLLAQYRVQDVVGPFVKSVFWGKVKRIDETSSYHETNGPVTVNGDILQLRFGEEYSFIMKDRVVEECITHIQTLQKEKE